MTSAVRPINTQIKGIIIFIVYATTLSLFSCNSEPSSSSAPQPETESVELNQQSNELSKKRIVFFGNSLTAGYGLEEEEAFTAHIQRRLDSLNLAYEVVNAGLSGETTAGGVRRIDWVLNQQMDIFFLELGGNDMLRGTDVKETETNLRTIIEKVRKVHEGIPIIIAGMVAPPNMGEEYTTSFARIYPKLAREYELTLIPFFLENVAGIPSLNLPDGIHPNAEGQRIVAKTVWGHLEQHL